MAVQRPLQGTLGPESESLVSSHGSFRVRKSLPHPRSDDQQRLMDVFVDGNHLYTSPKSLKRSNGASMPGNFPGNGSDATLPPTPPRHVHHQSRSASSPSNITYGSGSTVSSQPASGTYASPVGALDLPTPDASPPAMAASDLLPRPPLAAFSPSSRADSFKTAREEQWLSDEEFGGDYIYEDFSGAVKPPKHGHEDTDQGLTRERDDDDSTPTPKKLHQANGRLKAGTTHLNGSPASRIDTVPDREWDTNMMRNITVRRRKRPVSKPHTLQEDEERVAAREIVPKLFNGSSEDDDGPEPLTPSNDHFAQTMSAAQRLEERPKRYSGSSHTSTILEAIIVPSSPPRRRTLRHVSKNLSLRSDDGSSRPSSNHASIASDDLSMSQLNDRLRKEHINRMNGVFTPEPSETVPAFPLKHHPESRSLRAQSGTFGDLSRIGALAGTQNSLPSLQRHRARSDGYTLKASTGSAEHSGRLSFVPGPETVHVKYDPATKSSLQQSPPADQQLTRVATRKALQRLDSSAGTLDSRPICFARETFSSEPPAVVVAHVASHEDHSSPNIGPTLPEPELTSDPTARAIIKPNEKPSMETASVKPASVAESIPRVSFDQSISTHEMHRASNASSTLRADSEHANARHIFAQSTPFSQISEHEIGEANAINIYPHNNNSLLVVQQVARPSVVSKQGDDDSAIPGWPSLTVQPATPPQQFSAVNVDSPLKNPREPPIPPIINIHPATPASELDVSPLSVVQGASESRPPTRSLSLVQKARRYSDSMMRPIFTRTSSLRRSHYRRSRAPRHGAPRDSTADSKPETSGLHPFWQPRGFWDEYSDSDSESDWGEPEQGGTRRLPAGGDTTELGEPRGFAKVLDRSGFSRGFHIGNSLGLERAGTNRRKPIIQLPVGLGRRTSGRVVMKRNSQGTLQSIGSESLRSVRLAKRSVESLRQSADGTSRKAWNPRNWHVQYVGVGGMRDLWRQKQAEKRRKELKEKIGIRYSVEDAPTTN